MKTEHEIHADHPHSHGNGCGHVAVNHNGHTDYLHNAHLRHPHGDHVDYLVNGLLHHPDGGHCDNHGVVELVAAGKWRLDEGARRRTLKGLDVVDANPTRSGFSE